MKLTSTLERTSKLAILLYLLVGVGLALILSESWLPRLFPDDSFFYLSIARNFSEGQGSTFDGSNLTNGYHPAWMFLLSLYHKVSPLQGMSGLRAVMVLQTLLNATTFLLMAHTLRRLGVEPFVVGLAVVTAIFLVGFSNYGMEASLWLFGFWLLFLMLYELADGAGSYLGAAVAVVLAYASRSDSLLFIVPLSLITTVARTKQAKSLAETARCGLALFMPLLIAAATQAYINLTTFGDVKTISSSLKTNPIGQQLAFLGGSAERGMAAMMHKGVFAAVFALSLVFVVSLALRLRRGHRDLQTWFFFGANAYVLLFLTLITLTLREPPRTWYYTVAFTVLITTTAWLSGVSAKPRPSLLAIGSCLACVASLFALYKLYGSSPRENALQTAAWLKQNMAPGERAFVSDGSGIVNYFSERSVINGDGLVNNFDYQKYVREKRIREYLQQNNVRYVLANVNSPDRAPTGEINVFVHNWRGPNFVYASASAEDAEAVYTEHSFFGFAIFDAAKLRFRDKY